MKIDRKDLEKSVVELTVEADKKELAKYRKNAINHLKENTEVKGFRKGASIPEEILIKQVWDEKFSAIIIDFAIDDLYRKSLIESKLVPVAQGEIKEIVSQDPLKIKIHVEVLPEVEIDEAKMKKIKLTKKKITVSAKEVTEAITDIEKRFTTFEESSKKAKMGDRVTIDTDGYDKEDKLMETTSMRAYPLVLGSNLLVPGFEEKIVWAKAWDELDLDIVFPKDYHNADFAWNETKFKVKVIKVEQAVKPEFTEEFIEQLRGQKLDMTWFKKLIKEEIARVKESNANIENELKLIDELLKVSKLDLWEKLLAEQTNRMFAEVKENMAKQNIQMKDYLESLKMDEETYKEKHIKADSTKRLQWELILNKLVDIFKTEIKDSEVSEEVENIKKNYQNPEVLKRLDEMYVAWTKNFEELRRKMQMKKVIDSFFEVEKATKK